MFLWLKPIRNNEVYVNDMVIKGPNIRRLLEDVEEMFNSLEKVRMKLNPSKCTFGVKEGKFMGYYVSTEGIKPNLTKLDELMEVPSTHTLRDDHKLNCKLTALICFISHLA